MPDEEPPVSAPIWEELSFVEKVDAVAIPVLLPAFILFLAYLTESL